jgi:hypothetical protein
MQKGRERRHKNKGSETERQRDRETERQRDSEIEGRDRWERHRYRNVERKTRVSAGWLG